MHRPTMPTRTAPAPLTPLSEPPLLPAHHMPRRWASRSHIPAPPLLKCNTGWSERLLHQLERTQQGWEEEEVEGWEEEEEEEYKHRSEYDFQLLSGL